MKYLDKTFYKFTLGFLCIICISLLVMWVTTRYVENSEMQTATTGREE